MNTASLAEPSDLMQQAINANQSGEHKKAEALCHRLLKIDPWNVDGHFLLGTILLEDHQPRQAKSHIELAYKTHPEHPGILFALGDVYFQIGEWAAAITAYQALHAQGHVSAFTSLNLAIAMINIRDFTAAAVVLERALAAYPEESALWNTYADALNRQHRDKDAESAFQRALELAPDDPDIRANLALLYEQSNNLEQAEALALTGLQQHPRHASLLLTAARCARRRKQFQAALALLEQMAENADISFRRAAEFERGRIYDSIDEVDRAFKHFQHGNMLSYEMRPDSAQGGETYLKELDELVRGFERDGMLARLAENAELEAYAGPSPVFLLGFLRSGTTLMDTILQTYAEVTVLEEDPTLDNVIQHAHNLPGGYPRCLATATPADKSELRSLYWNTVNRIAGPLMPGKMLIDKQPLNSINAPLLFTLFPNARMLFALRHPCDVVLSCFMQMFGTSNALINFTSLESGAVIYSRFMQAWQDYCQILPLRVHCLRYEDLVRDKDRSLHAVLEFLGLDSVSAMEHSEKAKQRGRIYTPSYHQVIQPIYRDALNRWHRYRNHFDAALPILRPYIEVFGYEA